MEEKEKAPAHYYRQLDSLRFFSVAAVMIAHWVQWATKKTFLSTPHWGNGVIFFFVLSGFLITEILLRQKSEIDAGKRSFGNSLKIFYIRRTLRIFPVYFLLIIFLFIINFKNTREIFPYLATYTINIYEATNSVFVGSFNHFWSLAVEEQFYIFWPLCLFLIPSRHLPAFIIGVILLSIGSRLYYVFVLPEKWMAPMYLTTNVMFTLAIGACLAWLKYKRSAFFYWLSNSVIATPLMIAAYLLSFFCFVHPKVFPQLDFLFDEFLFSLAAMVIIARCAGPGYKFVGKWVLENKTFTHMGQISYGLYLFHLFAPTLFHDVISTKLSLHTEKNITLWIICFLITWGLAELSFKYIEKPVNELKKYFKY